MADRSVTDRAPALRQTKLQRRQDQAIHTAEQLRKQAPKLFAEPHVQFALASLHRQRREYSLADAIYYRCLSGSAPELWKNTAAAEIWLMQRNGFPPKAYAVCRRVGQRPFLDGVLDEDCWQRAEAMVLREPGADRAPTGHEAVRPDKPVARLAWDNGFLYFAAVIPYAAGATVHRPVYEGRHHDADLTGFDRISLYLDLDRDYTSYYALHIDQRGWVSESCWDDSQWDPQCYVAVDSDDQSWRIEAAVPFSELAAEPPRRRTVWAVGVVRTMPSVGIQSWTERCGITPRPESFGLIEFE